MNDQELALLERLLDNLNQTGSAGWEALVTHYRIQGAVNFVICVVGLWLIALGVRRIVKIWERLEDIEKMILGVGGGIAAFLLVVWFIVELSLSIPAMVNPDGYAISDVIKQLNTTRGK